METSLRYKKLIDAQLRMLQAKKEYQRAASEVNSNLLVAEQKNDDFDSTAAKHAFTEILVEKEDLKIVSANHVGATLTYRDIEVHLHHNMSRIGSETLRRLLKEG